MAPDAPPPSADYAPRTPKREGFAALPRHERRRLEALQRKHRSAEAKRRREAPVFRTMASVLEGYERSAAKADRLLAGYEPSEPLTMATIRARLVAGREADPVLFDRAIALADRVIAGPVYAHTVKNMADEAQRLADQYR